MSFRGVLAVDAVTRKRQCFDALFGDRLAAVFAKAVNAFIYFAQSGFNLFNGAVGVAGKFKQNFFIQAFAGIVNRVAHFGFGHIHTFFVFQAGGGLNLLSLYQFTDLGNGIYSVTFHSTGVYAITYSPGYISGTTFLNISFVWYVEVMDGEGEASITFVATDGTSFSEDLDPDGDGRYTITVDLTSNYTLPSSNIFADRGGKTLYGWSLTEGELNSDLRAGYTIRDLISMFNSQNIVLYAVWS